MQFTLSAINKTEVDRKAMNMKRVVSELNFHNKLRRKQKLPKNIFLFPSMWSGSNDEKRFPFLFAVKENFN